MFCAFDVAAAPDAAAGAAAVAAATANAAFVVVVFLAVRRRKNSGTGTVTALFSMHRGVCFAFCERAGQETVLERCSRSKMRQGRAETPSPKIPTHLGGARRL